MDFSQITATAIRLLRQLSHDPRTILLILFIPSVMIALFKFVLEANPDEFQRIAPLILIIFPFVLMFIVTSITTLRERTNGTFERLMSMPLSRVDLILGYAGAFAVLTTIQCVIASWITISILGVTVSGSFSALVITTLITGLLGMSLGLFASAFAESEFQAVQFMPAFIMPQILICGLFVDRSSMAGWLKTISDFLPLTYGIEAIKQIIEYPDWTQDLSFNLILITIFTFASLVLGAVTLRRTS